MKDDNHGLAHDLKRMAELSSRRRVLQVLGGVSLLPIVGCGSDSPSSSSDAGIAGAGGSGGGSGASGASGTNGGVPGDIDAGSIDAGVGGANMGDSGTAGGAAGNASGGTDAGSSTCEPIPDETGGPFPGDGSNGPNALNVNGVVRSDIRSSFGAMTGTAVGVNLTFRLLVVNTNALCAPLVGHAVYAWQCDKDGLYSLYTIADQNYLRGVQETDADGVASFISIFPGCYPGRWPHVHFDVFQNVSGALNGSGKLKTSQFALPADVCDAAFATPGYEQSVISFANLSLAMDGVFNDGVDLQMVTVTGNPEDGYVATLVVGIAA